MIVRLEIPNSKDASRTELQAKLSGVIKSKDRTRELIAVLKRFPVGLKITVESTQ